jgi:antitoxin component of RelBE/YafQ-DinJ toxin-antitoxin module
VSLFSYFFLFPLFAQGAARKPGGAGTARHKPAHATFSAFLAILLARKAVRQMAATAQLNVRLEQSLKQSGDAVLARHGVSPSEAVRGLWHFMAANQQLPAILDLQNPDSGKPAPPAAGLALEVAKRECGFTERPDVKWEAMTQAEREDWLADEMIAQLEASCR